MCTGTPTYTIENIIDLPETGPNFVIDESTGKVKVNLAFPQTVQRSAELVMTMAGPSGDERIVLAQFLPVFVCPSAGCKPQLWSFKPQPLPSSTIPAYRPTDTDIELSDYLELEPFILEYYGILADGSSFTET